MIAACPVCNGSLSEPLFSQDRAPIYQALRPRHVGAAQDFGCLELVRCTGCGHWYNRAYDEATGDRMYRGDVLSNMPVHITMTQNLESIAQWIGKERYAGQHVIEVGAGSGHLARILARDARSLLLFEPSQGLRKALVPEPNITVLNEPFAASRANARAGLVVCRQVLEHVSSPLALLRDMAAVLSPGGAIYLEVPRADYIAEHTALFDFYYPHVQYFREDSLERLVARAGLAIERRWLPKNGHDMGLLLQGATPRPVNASAKAGPDADGLCVRLSRRLDEVRRAVAALPGRVGMYGATWQGVAFLRACDDARPIAAAFDDSAAMAGCALYGPSQSVSIAQPSYAALRGLDVVIITAYLHDAVIAEKLRAMQFAGRILTIRPDGESPSLARAW